jgi:hypothetical protein
MFCFKFYKATSIDLFSTLELVVSPDEARLHLDVSPDFAGSTETRYI